MKQMRILHIINGFAVGEQSGGAELFAIQLARNLAQTSCDVAVFGMWQYASGSEIYWTNILEKENIIVSGLIFPTRQTISDIKKVFTHLWTFVHEFKPDVINSHSERGDFFNMLLHLFHPVHPASVRTMHTDEQWQHNRWLGTLLINGLFPITYNVEIAISKAVLNRLNNRFLAKLTGKRAELCYNGLDENIFLEPKKRDCTFLQKNDYEPAFFISVVGRLVEQKGHKFLLEALKIVREQTEINIKLIIIGSGLLEQTLKQKTIILELQNNVQFLGSRNDVINILPCFDLMVLPSLWEGFPTVLLEAMALNVPVIATDVSGSRELVIPNQTGILVPAGNPTLLAKAILFAVKNPERLKAMTYPAKQLASKYTIQNTAALYTQIYQDIVNGL